MIESLAYARMFARFPFALRRFLSETLTIERAREIVRARLQQREENFLRLMERGVYSQPESPYLGLLKNARCELGDLRALVMDKGLDPALMALRAEGVYIKFEELKGRKPIERNGFSREVTTRDFDNPVARHDFTVQTGGSTGLATLVGQDLDHIAAGAPMLLLMLDAFGLLDAPTAQWSHILPGTGFRFILQRAYLRQFSEHWYSSMGWKDSPGWLKYDAATMYMVFCARRCGLDFPFPEIVRLDEAIVVARWISKTLRERGKCFLATNVSHAFRVCVAAREAGVDLRGATFRMGGEPVTPAKARIMEDSGIQIITGYGMVEVSTIGLGCPNAIEAGDVHLASDTVALITHPYAIEGTDVTVPAFQITTLSESVPKLMLNVQVDDYGIVEQRACGCALEACGYATHLREIRSYSKLLGEGVTLIGNDMVHILEHVLPARFGGSAFDYQLSEEEDEKGITRVYLVISPRITIREDTEVIEALHAALRSSSPAAGVASTVWKQAQTIRVKRAEPVWTARGKLMPLHIHRSNPARQPR
jgi:hypothetical protein